MRQQRTTYNYFRPLREVRVLFLLSMLVMGVMPMWGKVQTVNGKTYNVVYMSSAGAGNTSGDDAANAVSGWTNAYKKLSKTGGTYEDDWNYNIIVIVGSTNIQINTTESNTKDIPATITNVWPWEDNSGNSLVSGSIVSNGCKLILNGSARACRIGAPTRFKNVCFTSNGSDCRFCLFLHHTMFDVGCVMNNMGTLSTDMGAMNTSTHKAPSFHLMLFSDENDFTQTTSPASAPWNQTEPMTLTIKSGRFGRILCTRIAGTDWGKQTSRRYTIGKPDQPLMAKIEVDIEKQSSDYNPTGYKDDIAFLCAGTTQGTVFADVQMDIKRGQIATIVGGSQGNAIAACAQNGIPTSTYCGRTTVNVIGENDDDVKIFRYFGGCLGRLTNTASGTCSAYFYGHSILNFVHGTIEQDIFASGGGLSGLRNPNNGTQHTSDQFIPYQGGSNPDYPFLGIDYSSFDASKNIVQITSVLKGSTPEVIDLADTKIITNISGGVVKGNVYGGSYGYSSEMVLKGAPEGAGSLWGNTEVNISGGTIGVMDSKGKVTGGNVYGGGAGAKSYYNLATTDDDRAKYLTVATVYGNTNLTITGKPTILGNIFGGGAGLASQAQNAKDTINVNGTITYLSDCEANEFLDIAKVYGNTNVTINADDDWTFTGNIYGGGAKGAVAGNTNVTILGGIIDGDVFGAGEGEEGHPDKAKVTGTTNVTVGE